MNSTNKLAAETPVKSNLTEQSANNNVIPADIKSQISTTRLVMDGALGTELEALIPKLSDIQPKLNPLWSGMVLLNQPELVQQVHYNYLKQSEVDMLITSTYQVSYDSLHKYTDLDDPGIYKVWDRSVKVIQSAIAQHRQETKCTRHVSTIGSIGPYATFLADGSEYTGVYKNVTEEELETYHLPLTKFFLGHKDVDAIAFETIPTFLELKAILKMMARLLEEGQRKYFYVSFNFLTDRGFGDRTSVKQAMTYVVSQLAENELLRKYFLGVGLNCLDYKYITSIVEQIVDICNKEDDMDLPVIVYPNLGFFYDEEHDEYRVNKDMKRWETLVREWLGFDNVRVIGGCCSTLPVEIKVVREIVDEFLATERSLQEC